MRRPFPKTLLVAFLLIAAAVTASARTFPIEKITRDKQEFFGTVSYDVEKAYAGNHNLELSVSLNTQDKGTLELTGFDPPDQTKIEFKKISDDEALDSSTGLRTTQYTYLADIPENTEPRIYLITMTFAFSDHKNINRTFWLYVGVRSKGKLVVDTDNTSTTEFYTGTTNKPGRTRKQLSRLRGQHQERHDPFGAPRPHREQDGRDFEYEHRPRAAWRQRSRPENRADVVQQSLERLQ